MLNIQEAQKLTQHAKDNMLFEDSFTKVYKAADSGQFRCVIEDSPENLTKIMKNFNIEGYGCVQLNENTVILDYSHPVTRKDEYLYKRAMKALNELQAYLDYRIEQAAKQGCNDVDIESQVRYVDPTIPVNILNDNGFKNVTTSYHKTDDESQGYIIHVEW